MALLSQAEAVSFLQDILNITDVHEKLTNDKAALLDEIINRFQQKIPYQSINVISKPEMEQHISTLDDMKAQMFSTQGGICYDLNVFMKHLLEALGFEVSLNACDLGMTGLYDHVSVLVKNLIKPGDKYYVDVGSADPFFQAISMNFDKESPVYKCGFQFYKFVKEGEVLSWWQKVNMTYSIVPITEKDIIIDGWRKYMTFTLEPRDIGFFSDYMIKHYVTKEIPKGGISLLRFMLAVAFPNKKLLAIRGTSLFCENDEGKIENTKITSKEELVGLYGKYFPQLPADLVEIAADKMNYNFQKVQN